MIRSQDTHLVWYIVCTYTDFPSLCKGLKFTDVFNDLNLQLKKNDLKKKVPVDLIGGSRPALFLINSW